MGQFIATGYDSETFEPLERSVRQLVQGGGPSQTILFGGRGNVRSDQWYGPHSTYGVGLGMLSTSYGRGPNPTLGWTSRGFQMRAGQELMRLDFEGRSNSTSARKIEFALYFFTGPFGNGFDSNSEVSPPVEITRLSIASPTNDRNWQFVDDIGFVVPSDGYIVPLLYGKDVKGNRLYWFDLAMRFK